VGLHERAFEARVIRLIVLEEGAFVRELRDWALYPFRYLPILPIRGWKSQGVKNTANKFTDTKSFNIPGNYAKDKPW
jgi:hypothetical protein